MMDVWGKVFTSEARNFDEPARWLLQPTVGRADFTGGLLRAVAEMAAWAAQVASDLDDPDERARLTAIVAAMEQLLGVLRVGAAEAATREVQGE